MATFLDALTDQKDRKELVDVLSHVQPQMDSLITELSVHYPGNYNTQNIIDKLENNMIHFRYVNENYPDVSENASGWAKRSWDVWSPDSIFIKPVEDKFLSDLSLENNSIRTLIHELWHHAGPVKGWGSKDDLSHYIGRGMGPRHDDEKDEIGTQSHYNEAEEFMVNLLKEEGLWETLQGILPNEEENRAIRGH